MGRIMRKRFQSGFTLVELLVVMSIIGVLVALLLPAVESVRESARKSTCGNNLHQLALGCLQHESAQGFLPTGGWGLNLAGDPDQGFGRNQPGGWHYNILPYIDQQQLHDMNKLGNYSDYLGSIVTSASKSTAAVPQARRAVAVFNCPTRRKLASYAAPSAGSIANVGPPIASDPPMTFGRSDYAGCGGSNFTGVGAGPGSVSAGLALTDVGGRATTDWSQYPGTRWDYTSGVFFRRSVTKLASIHHGVACTYLIGERNICPDYYSTGTASDDDQGWDQGYDSDTIRWTGQGWYTANGTPQYNQGTGCALSTATPIDLAPMRNTTGCQQTCDNLATSSGTMVSSAPSVALSGSASSGLVFGSAHADGFNMVTCDGAAHKMSYNIDPEVHRRLGDCIDKSPVNLTVLAK